MHDCAERSGGGAGRSHALVVSRCRGTGKTGLRLASHAAASGRVEGEVVKVDIANGKVTIREPDGRSREYLASQETLRDIKEGDRVQFALTQPRSC